MALSVIVLYPAKQVERRFRRQQCHGWRAQHGVSAPDVWDYRLVFISGSTFARLGCQGSKKLACTKRQLLILQ
ncbi:MAG TPA: hypothetical protein VLR50_10260, partial [Desulfobacterales bacterium]|nr:hypothetical protein [Desulfobacterales bacterium]